MHTLANGFPDSRKMTREELEGSYECATNVLREIREALNLEIGDDVKGAVRALVNGAPQQKLGSVYGFAVTDCNENHRNLILGNRPSIRREAVECANNWGGGAEVHALYDGGALYVAEGSKHGIKAGYTTIALAIRGEE